MENMMNLYWDETAVAAKYAADAAEAEKSISRKTGSHRSRSQKKKDTIRMGKKRHEDALLRYKEDKVPVSGKLRFHQMPRDKGSDNIHNIRAEQAAKVELKEFLVEFDAAEEAVSA